jgi:hypothetical protein
MLAVASVLLGVLGFFLFASRIFIVIYPSRIEVLVQNMMGVLGISGLILGLIALAWVSRSAVMSMSLGLLGFLLPPLAATFYWRLWTNYTFLRITGLLGICALICGVLFAVQRLGRAAEAKRAVIQGACALFGIVATGVILFFWLNWTYHPRSIAPWLPVRSNLSRLGRAMLVYAHRNNGRYPDPNQWCDLLLKSGEAELEHFVSPSFEVRRRRGWRKLFSRPAPKRGRCHFAMNPNCKLNSPPDTVMLFESEEGWNRFGGPELVTTRRHDGEWCAIVYNDTQQSGKRRECVGQLNWGDERKQSRPAGSKSNSIE